MKPCIHYCSVCNQPLPDWDSIVPKDELAILSDYVVVMENGTRNYVPQECSEARAESIALIGTSRCAGLCYNHMVRVVKVEKVVAKPSFHME